MRRGVKPTKRRGKADALEQQRATSEILRVISSSPTDVQPVFDTIVRNAVQLCDAVFGRVFRRDGDAILLAANANFPDELGHHPAPLNQDTLTGRVIMSGRVHLSVDVESDPAIPPRARETYRHRGVRSILSVPMLREGQAIGAIAVGHRDAGAFTDVHVGLLRTFADQAVITIGNVRLFNELQDKNRALTESLDRQTPTSEILQSISISPTDVQPVLAAVARNAARLCDSYDAQIVRVAGDHWRSVASYGSVPAKCAGRTLSGRIDAKAALLDGAIEISVTDTGIGIAQEDQEAVFEEFRQVGGADQKAEGTGLGLALCRKFVELHGGKIWLRSQVGAGSTFTFSLPVGRGA